MEESPALPVPVSSVLLSVLGTLMVLVDVVLDVWAVVSLGQQGEFGYMALLIAVLLGSSVLVQVFSWLWYTQHTHTRVDTLARRYGLVGLLHICQLGVFLRLASLAEILIYKILRRDKIPKKVAAHLKHDMSTLRLFETFSESIPQLVLLITIIMQEQELHPITGFKILGSLMSISTSVLFYHRDMCKFTAEEQRMGWFSSGVYFVWNLFLISPRVLAVALFSSALPCFLAPHFLGLWLVLVLWAGWQKTNLMDTKGGEWLYRATVGLIWYFSWFNVTEGNSRVKSLVHQAFLGADTALLLGLWFWRRSTESARLPDVPVNPYVLLGALPALYITGFLLKLLYFWKLHPKSPTLSFESKDQKPQVPLRRFAAKMDPEIVTTDSFETDSETEPQTVVTGVEKRMRNMAANFYF